MEYRRVGSTDLNVSVLGFGCAPVGSRCGAVESRRALAAAFEQGITYFDTADMYGVGGSEEILGRVFKGRMDKVVIGTKCGYSFSTRLKAIAWVKPLLRPLVTRLKSVKASAAAVMSSQRSQNFEPAYIEQCVHGSLKRLGVDRIDVFYLHDPTMAVVERPEVFEKLRELKRAGKLRHLAVSSDRSVVARAIELHGSDLSVVQTNANLLESAALTEVLPLARARGIGMVSAQPFSHGRIFHDQRLGQLLRDGGLPTDAAYLSGLALRYLKQFDGICSILPSMMRAEHLRANIDGIGAGPLNDKERAVVAALGAPGAQG
jgi:aryl-alcohol dehydrogenase-like predicted oxidoreductase